MTGSPRFRHLDDTPWQECRSQQHGDRTASVWEKWLAFSPEYLSLYARWDPGMMVHAHGHNSNHVVFVIEGEMGCGDVRCPAANSMCVGGFGSIAMKTSLALRCGSSQAALQACQAARKRWPSPKPV